MELIRTGGSIRHGSCRNSIPAMRSPVQPILNLSPVVLAKGVANAHGTQLKGLQFKKNGKSYYDISVNRYGREVLI